MPRSRIEIQKKVNTYRASVEDKGIALNDPMWDNKLDPRYISVVKSHNNDVLELIGLERELEEAKARGERGRSLAEIRKEISETQSIANEYSLMQNRAGNPQQRFFLGKAVSLMQCNVNALQQELIEAIEAIEEENSKPQKKNSIQEKAAREKAEKERIARERAQKEKIAKEKAAIEKAEKERIKKEKNEIAEIKRRYEQRIRNNPNDANNYKIRALGYYAKGYYNLAIDDYTKTIEIDSNNKDAYQKRGIVYTEIKEYNKAINDFSKAIDLDPNDADIYALRGMAYSIKGDYDKAVVDFDKAIHLDPKCKNAYYGKGTLYGVKGEHDKSFANYKRALQLDPTDSITANLLENARKANEKQQRERKENTKKITSRILCVSAPILAVLSVILFFMQWGSKTIGIITIIPFLVIFFSGSYRKARKVICLILDIFLLIYTLPHYHISIVVGGCIITNLASVVLAMLFPKDNLHGY